MISNYFFQHEDHAYINGPSIYHMNINNIIFSRMMYLHTIRKVENIIL